MKHKLIATSALKFLGSALHWRYVTAMQTIYGQNAFCIILCSKIPIGLVRAEIHLTSTPWHLRAEGAPFCAVIASNFLSKAVLSLLHVLTAEKGFEVDIKHVTHKRHATPFTAECLVLVGPNDVVRRNERLINTCPSSKSTRYTPSTHDFFKSAPLSCGSLPNTLV